MKISSGSFANTNHFSVEIESLRGIAALLVVIGHFYIVTTLPVFLQTPSAILRTLMAGFFNPQPAVLLFFTISGLVLGRQLRKESIQNLPEFLAYLCRRGFRLVPLMWAATIFAFFLHYLQTHTAHSKLLYANLMLQDISLNLPLWSLKVELICSIFFPILFWAFVTGGVVWNALLFVGLSILSYFWQDPIFLQFLVFFHAGLLIDYFNAKSTKPLRIINPLSLIVFILVFMLAPEYSIGARNWSFGHWQSWVLPEIIACSFILFFIVHKTNSKVNSFLRLRIVRYLGKISFSIYLFHFPLLMFLIKKVPMAEFYQLAAFTIAYFSMVILIASATYHWIEMPTNKIGRKLSRFLLERNRAVSGDLEQVSA